jgi:16S rRNA (adenine1518-N6/adenine1519-N6)-dimethyltransferase
VASVGCGAAKRLARPLIGVADLSHLPALRDVIRSHELSAVKSLGQHFLLDTNLIDRIARVAGPLDGINVIEVGPGPGGLTRALLAHDAASVTAIEKDTRCVAALADLVNAAGGRLTVLGGDALSMDIAALTASPRRIVANLPYNVATVLLLQWFRRGPFAEHTFDRIVVMVQKEVADRLAAKPSTKDYGRLSVAAQWHCIVKSEFNVAPSAFAPPPKVQSSIVTLTPREAPPAPAEWRWLESVTAAAFNQRRKMLRSALKSWNFDFAALGIDPEARAETLSVDEFCVLARQAERMNAEVARR